MPNNNLKHETIIKKLFQICDVSHWDELSQIFTTDVIYCRPHQKSLNGIELVIHFFKNDRPIASGIHHLHKIFCINESSAVVLGWFSGHLKDGAVCEVSFADFLVFSEDKICFRKTYVDNQTEDDIGKFLLGHG